MRPVRRPRAGPSFGSRLLGSADESPRRRRIRVQVLLTGVIVLANVAGAVGVVALITLLVPDRGDAAWPSVVAGAAYLVVAVLVGLAWGTRTGLASLRWVSEDREPDEGEQRRTLRVPLRLLRVQALFWLLAAAFFAVLSWDIERGGGLKIGLTVLMAGIVTCAVAYLLSEFAMRPLAARALAAHPPDRLLVPGVTARIVFAWVAGSGIPVLGLFIGAIFALTDSSITADRLAVTIFVLGGITIVSGLLLTLLALRATIDPIRSVRRGLAQLADGDLDVSVPVYDGTEVGLLQAGFNDMVSGLRERERIRYVFERHVGEDVARDAIAHDHGLGGEVRPVAVLFADVAGSTTLAGRLPPEEVVELLNRFFAVAVDVVGHHGGLVNKLIGDAVLAVWGAPGDVPDRCSRALAAARELAARLVAEVPELHVGIGVAAGEVLAGNIGAVSRFEYTVIGDPVNAAARLTELAKAEPGRLLAAARVVDEASSAERARWVLDGEVTLRGRDAPTPLSRPRSAVS